MKIKLVLVSICILGIAFFSLLKQEEQFETLEEENQHLQKSLTEKAHPNSIREQPPSKIRLDNSISDSKRLETAKKTLEECIENYTNLSDFSPESHLKAQQSFIVLINSLSALNHLETLQLLPSGPYDFEQVEDENEQIQLKMGTVFFAIKALQETNPKEALFLIREITQASSPPDQVDSLKIEAFQEWSKYSPAEALKWYEEELSRGATDLEHFEILALSIKALLDPAEAIESALNAKNPKALKSSLHSLRQNIKDIADHRRFLAQLNLAQKNRPHSEPLAKFRTSYIHHLNQTLTDEYFEDATRFVAENYSSKEQALFIKHISRVGDLSEPAKWADWLVRIGDQRAYTRFVGAVWGTEDPEAVGRWLNQRPDSPSKHLIITEYAFQLAQTQPVAAAEWAQALPESERKKKLLRKIENHAKQ